MNNIMKFAQTLLIAVIIIFLPANMTAMPRDIHAEWMYPYNNNAAGFRLYHENKLLCETDDPGATSMQCSVDAPDGESWFTMTT